MLSELQNHEVMHHCTAAHEVQIRLKMCHDIDTILIGVTVVANRSDGQCNTVWSDCSGKRE